jgi:hypothetical protein
MEQVKDVIPKNEKIVTVVFADGFIADFDVTPFIREGVSGEIADRELFFSVHVDDFGGISWANGFDFCPVFLRNYLQTMNPS